MRSISDSEPRTVNYYKKVGNYDNFICRYKSRTVLNVVFTLKKLLEKLKINHFEIVYRINRPAYSKMSTRLLPTAQKSV